MERPYLFPSADLLHIRVHLGQSIWKWDPTAPSFEVSYEHEIEALNIKDTIDIFGWLGVSTLRHQHVNCHDKGFFISGKGPRHLNVFSYLLKTFLN